MALVIGATPAAAEPLYDATVDTVFDIITVDDPSAFDCYRYRGLAERQMWDKRIDAEICPIAHVFDVQFADAPVIEFTVNPEFTAEAAAVEVQRHALALGRLPIEMRRPWARLGIHMGEESYSAGPGLSFVYTGRTDWLLTFNHLEESLFHEGVHVALDALHAGAADWHAAQDKDGTFLTGYAQSDPEGEDLAETLLFAYGLELDRMPPADAEDIRAAIPARLAYIGQHIPLSPPVKAGANAGPCAR
ncbi:hypothetical protein [Tabrizicola sp.]|uniref:hypothetical protein n=1 Tax=Tabrizicola sp. TaxID=2005166 RepID=UPI003F2CD76E